MNITAVDALVRLLRQHSLVDPARLEEARSSPQARPQDPEALAGELVRRGLLTKYQADLLLQGRADELVLGSYVLLEPLGEGGMGQVFKARQRKLGRIDAVKVVRAERVADADALKRFQREMVAAAQLSHPNVVHAYYADEDRGRHYFAMELLAGLDLDEVVRRKGPLPFAEACEYTRQAALGLQHAHERGLVHRDVKPSNLLLTPEGTVKVLDLGLARVERRAGGGDATLTQEGAVMGTPDYIAPEQVRESRGVDARADLYSLGCTLYFLLTGRPPFPDRPLAAKLAAHLFEAPEPVERLRPGTPPAVAALLRRLMAKKPEDRFPTAGELAAALAAVGKGPAEVAPAEAGPRTEGLPAAADGPTVAGGPTTDAAPAGSRPAARRAPRRKGGRAFLWASIGIVFIGAAAALAWALWYGSRPAAAPPLPPPAAPCTLVFQSDDADLRLLVHPKGRPHDAHEATPGEPLSLAPGDYEWELAPETALGLRLSAREGSLAPEGRATVRVEGLPISPFALVSRPAAIDGVQSWTVVTRAGRGGVNHLAFSPDGKWLAVAYEDDVVRLLTASGEFARAFVVRGDRVRALAWSPDKADPQLAVAGDRASVHVCSADGRFTHLLPVGAAALAWSPDGKTLACADGSQVQFWDVAGEKLARPPLAQDGPIHCLAWSPDGAVVAAAGDDGAVHLWRGPDWKEEVRPGHAGPVVALAWSPDSALLASAGRDGAVRRWPAAPGAASPPPIAAGKPPLTAVAWVVDKTGPKIVSSGDGGPADPSLQFWDPATGKAAPAPALNAGPMLALAQSPDRRILACGGFSHGTHLWNLNNDKEHLVVPGQEGDMASATAWSPDGKHLTTDGWAGTVFVWDAASGELTRHAPVPSPARTAGASFGPRGTSVAFVCGDQAYLWHMVGDKLLAIPKAEGLPRLTTHSPEIGLMAVAYDDRRVRLWETPARQLKLNLDATRDQIGVMAWTPDARFLAAGDDGGAIYLWEAASGRRLHEWAHPGKVLALAWSPDGKTLAAAGADGSVTLWDRDGDKPLASLGGGHGPAGPVSWAPDGRSLAVLGDGPYLRRWDVGAKEVRRQVRIGPVHGEFSPDGALIASPSRSWTLRLWEAATGRPLGTAVRLDQGWLVLSEEGHYRPENDEVEKELVCVVQTEEGQQTLRPDEFAAKYHWKNDRDKARLDTR